MDRVLHLVVLITTGLIALLLVGGSIAGYLLGRPLPEWLATADGMIIAGAFAGGAFFAQARAASPTGAALKDLLDRYHQLAQLVVTATAKVTHETPVTSAGAAPTGETTSIRSEVT